MLLAATAAATTITACQAFFGPIDKPAVGPVPRCAVQIQWNPEAPTAPQLIRQGDNAFPGEQPCNRSQLLAIASALAREIQGPPPAGPSGAPATRAP